VASSSTVRHGLAEAGFVVLVHGHRNFAASSGEPGYDINTRQQQIADSGVISTL
jgi:hypothetical protein